MLTIETISGLLIKFHGEIKEITGFMAKNVLVVATQLDVTYSKTSLWAKFGRFSSIMVVVITKKPCEKEFSRAWDQAKIQILVFTPSSCRSYHNKIFCQLL